VGKLLRRDRPVIFGDGSQTRDFVYVDDVVDAFVRSSEKGGGLLMNIGTGVETSVQQLYDVMARLTGFKEPARYEPPRTGELPRSALDPSRAIHLAGAVDEPRRCRAHTQHFESARRRPVVTDRRTGVKSFVFRL
jgi:UDP-glucose 4-epimerase